MKRRNLGVVLSTVGLGVAGLLSVLGLVMASNASFAKTYVKDQLSQQRIKFPTVDALTEAERKSPCLRKFAGQPLTTGKQAECYANDFIGLHLKSVAKGQTYAEMRVPEQAMAAKVAAAQKANDPALADLQKQHAALKGQRDALFQGETSRGLLLTSFGFSDLGTKAGQAATVAYSVAAVLALLSGAGFARVLLARRSRTVADPSIAKTTDNRQLVGA